MTSTAGSMIFATRTLIDHLMEEHTAAWKAEFKQFYGKYRVNLRRKLEPVQQEFDELVRARLYAFVDEVTDRTAADLASVKTESPMEGAIEHLHELLTYWCDELGAQRREIMATLFGGFGHRNVNYHTHAHLLTKAYRAAIEQPRCARFPDPAPRLPARAVSAATPLEEIKRMQWSESDQRAEAAPAIKPPPPAQPTLATKLRDHGWEEIGLAFVAEDALKIKSLKADRFSRCLTYAELGFKDGRKGDRPNTLWFMLKDIVANNGVIDWSPHTAFAHSPRGHDAFTSKNMSRLARTLRTATGIEANPFKPYVRKTNERYEACFKILKTEIPVLKFHRDESEKSSPLIP